jgi:hypothetical protein
VKCQRGVNNEDFDLDETDISEISASLARTQAMMISDKVLDIRV